MRSCYTAGEHRRWRRAPRVEGASGQGAERMDVQAGNPRGKWPHGLYVGGSRREQLHDARNLVGYQTEC